MRKLKKAFSLTLALALSLALAAPAFATGTVKVVEDETHGVKITLNGFLREETHRYNVWTGSNYDEDTYEEIPIMEPREFTIYVVADNSTVTIEALKGRKYADASFQGLNRWVVAPGSPSYNSSVREAWITFLDNRENYAYSCEGDGGTTDWWVWDIEYKCFVCDYNFTWPLDKAVTETVSPDENGDFYMNLSTGYGIDWMCESDYAKLVPVDGGQPSQPTTPPQPEQPARVKTANPTNDKLMVNGAEQSPTVYKIGGSNYFKIRDVAAVLNGTGKQFAVGYSGGKVTVTSGQPYDATGKELAGAPDSARDASPSNDTILIDGTEASLTVYKIGGSNYFKLRDLGKALDFYVGYEGGKVTIDTGKSYAK